MVHAVHQVQVTHVAFKSWHACAAAGWGGAPHPQPWYLQTNHADMHAHAADAVTTKPRATRQHKDMKGGLGACAWGMLPRHGCQRTQISVNKFPAGSLMMVANGHHKTGLSYKELERTRRNKNKLRRV